MLEAIVALVLISSAGLALFSWINVNIAALGRIHDTNTRSEATLNIVEYMERVNPMLAPEGNAALGGYSIKWDARPATNITEGSNYPRGISLYQWALYDTDVVVSKADGGKWFDLRLQQVGYKKVRSISVDD